MDLPSEHEAPLDYMLQVSQLVTKVATIKRPNNHENVILWSDDPALTGKNPEEPEGPFMIAVVVNVDV